MGLIHEGQAHAEAELMHAMHAISQVLQPMRCPGKEYDIVGIHQWRDPPPRPELHTNSGSLSQHIIMQPIKENAKYCGTKRATLQLPRPHVLHVSCTAGWPAVPAIFIAIVPGPRAEVCAPV